jgi:hypothetical protein
MQEKQTQVDPYISCLVGTTEGVLFLFLFSKLDPDSIRSVDPDPYPESGSGSRKAKMTHKIKRKKNHVLKSWIFSFER